MDLLARSMIQMHDEEGYRNAPEMMCYYRIYRTLHERAGAAGAVGLDDPVRVAEHMRTFRGIMGLLRTR